MNIQDAQRELRQAYMGGFVGQLVAAVIWALAAALGTWVSEGAGMAALFFVSMFLFPITQLIFRLMGRSTKLGPGNTLDQLAMQIAFTVPIGFILVGAATLHHTHWFFPAAMVIVGRITCRSSSCMACGSSACWRACSSLPERAWGFTARRCSAWAGGSAWWCSPCLPLWP